MYVISCRPERSKPPGSWTALYSGNGLRPIGNSPQPNFLPAALVQSLTDPVLVVVHGYNNLETDAFSQYASLNGLTGSRDSLPAHNFPGTIIGFDWPSTGSHSPALWTQFGVYRHDLDAARQIAVPALANFLARLTAAVAGSGIRINVLAHSMGNFVVSRALMANPGIAARLHDVVSFAPDMLQTDLETAALTSVEKNIAGCWFVYWAQADFVLLTASNWANILLGNEQWRGRRLGQEGPRWGVTYEPSVQFQDWDVPLAAQMGSSYNWDIREWPFSMKIHGLYWSNGPFLDNLVANLCRADGASPVIKNWPQPPRPR